MADTHKIDGHLPFTNRLAGENSPYLRQHAHNPVDWYPWGDAAIQKARSENKLLLISIGYSACHWCHVMEKESFMDEGIADIMNTHFVCIKVDREERPDLDQVYMAAVQLLTGHGGWPLNCFALPGGEPVYGGTYFRPQEWQDVLKKLSAAYSSDPEKVKTHAEELKEGVIRMDLIQIKKESGPFKPGPIKQAITKWKAVFDTSEGGNLGAPKFPLPNSIEFLLQYEFYHKDTQIRDHVIRTLDKMMQGGIYDHVEGGFARYATDRYWRIPHFEKMLYDNAQMVSLYSKAYARTRLAGYRDVVRQTLDFLTEQMRSGDGGFYSSFDADSEGKEGAYYVWTKKEFDSILGDDAAWLAPFYNVTESGNWEQVNILYQTASIAEFCKTHNISQHQFRKILKRGHEKLSSVRKARSKPALDNKMLTSWNALMLKAYLDAYKVLKEEEYLQIAIENAHFLKQRIAKDGRIYRTDPNGIRAVYGFLDDYALTIDAFISLYTVTLDISWLQVAVDLTDHTLKYFHDSFSGMFYYTSESDPALVARKMEIPDNVIPSSNSVMAGNLYYLGVYFGRKQYTNMSKQMLQNVMDDLSQNGIYYSNWGISVLRFIHPQKEVVVMGPHARQWVAALNDTYMPDIIVAGQSKPGDLPLLKNRFIEGKDLVYICRNNVCDLPEKSLDAAIQKLIQDASHSSAGH